MRHLTPFSLRTVTVLGAALAMTSLSRAQTLVRQFDGSSNNDMYGHSVANAGDVNGDGVDDMIVGIPNGDPGIGQATGMARVYSGVTGAVLHTFPGTAFGDRMGWAVAGAGDVDGDNHADVIVSAVHLSANGPNRVHVFSGASGSPIYVFSGSATDAFGYSVSGAGDVDGDGLDDVLIGIPWSGSGAGSIQVRGTGLFGLPILTASGTSLADRFGRSVSGGADVDGDAVPDFAVGAPATGSALTGYVDVLSGVDASVIYHRIGSLGGSEYGTSVCLQGDITGDGVADLVVGAPREDLAAWADVGRVRVYSGVGGNLLVNYSGLAAGDSFGQAVGVARVFGSNLGDVVVGAPGDDTVSSDAGSVTVFSTYSSTVIFRAYGQALEGGLGWSVAGAGTSSLSGSDEFEEILAGAPAQNGPLSPGSVQVWSARNGTNYCVGATNSVGLSGRIAALGSRSVSSGTFVLRATNVTPGKPGIFYYGPSQTQVPLGAGFRCIGGQLTRLQPTLVTSASGLIALGVDLTAEPMHSDIALMAPLTMNFQFWHRDDPATSNLTDAVAVDFVP